MTTRRRHGEDGISFEHRGPCRDPHRHRNCPGLWRGEFTTGYTGDGKRTRRKVSGTTKAAVIDKLRDLHHQLDTGITPKPGYTHYTVRQAAQDWLAHGLDGRSPKTVTKNQNMLEPILAIIGARKLRDLTAADVRQALAAMAAGYSTAAVSMGHLALKRTIRHAEANDLISRNVATLTDTPQGQPGRPSKSLTLDQAAAVITAARTLPVMELRPGLKDVRRPAELMHTYIVLSLLAGIRTEEARALHWAHVDLDGDPAARPPVPPHVAVWRSVRVHGDTKTERSRRTLGLPAAAVQALHAWSDSQAGERLAAGDHWHDTGLVFTTHHGAALDAGNVRKMFKRVCEEAGIGDGWTPRELRTSFVSLLSHHGVSIEEIARLVGHASTRTTEVVYRRELRPVITTGAEIMDQLFTGNWAPAPAGNRRLARASRRSLVTPPDSLDGKPWPSSRTRGPSRNVTIRGRHQLHIADSARPDSGILCQSCSRMQAVRFPGSVLSVTCPELGTGHAYRYQAQPLQPPAVTLVTALESSGVGRPHRIRNSVRDHNGPMR